MGSGPRSAGVGEALDGGAVGGDGAMKQPEAGGDDRGGAIEGLVGELRVEQGGVVGDERGVGDAESGLEDGEDGEGGGRPRESVGRGSQ